MDWIILQPMKTILCILAVGLAYGGDAAAAQWKQIAKSSIGELWVDVASVKRNDGDVAFEYRIEFPKPQPVVDSPKELYRSTITKAIVRCAARAISIGPTVAYAGSKGTGKVVGTFPPSPEDARFQPVEPDSSDENLWRHACSVAKLVPQK